MAKTYSLNDMGVTADDLIMLDAAGISFDETDNISEEKRDEILSELYKLKQKAKEDTKAPEDKNKEIEPATAEQIRDMNRRLKNGEHLSANEVASAVAAGGIVSKDMRAEIKNTVVNFANSENAGQEDARAVAYLLDELDGKHVDDQKNRHSVEEYKKQFNDNPEILEAASKKLEAVNNAPATAAKTYSKEDIDGMMKAADVYLKAPDEVDNHEILEKANPKYKETHAQLFEDQLKEIQDVIRDYGEGKADISPEAAESMQKLIETYGKEYSKGKLVPNMSYDVTPEAALANQRLAFEKPSLAKALEEKNAEKAETKEEVVVEQTEEEKNAPKYSRDDIRGAHKTAGKDRTVEQWKMLYEQIDHNPELKTDKDREKAKKKLDEDFNRTANKGVKKAFEEEKAFNQQAIKKIKYNLEAAPLADELIEKIANAKNDADRQDAINVFKLETARQYVANQRDEGLLDFVRKDLEEKLNNNGGDKNRKIAAGYLLDENGKLKDNILYKDQSKEQEQSNVAPTFVANLQNETQNGKNSKPAYADGVKESKDVNGPLKTAEAQAETKAAEKPADEKKRKKGLFGRIGDWAKRNWKKVAVGAALVATALFGAKSCNNTQTQGNNEDKAKTEIKTQPKQQQDGRVSLPEVEVKGKQTFDLNMAHQYCKRMGYQDNKSEDDAIAKYLLDRGTYERVSSKVASHLGIDKLSTDEQMAILATVRGNTPDKAPMIDAIIKGTETNVAKIAKSGISKETEKFLVKRENGTIQYKDPEQFTKQTGTQSIEVSKDKIAEKGKTLGYHAAQRLSNSGR